MPNISSFFLFYDLWHTPLVLSRFVILWRIDHATHCYESNFLIFWPQEILNFLFYERQDWIFDMNLCNYFMTSLVVILWPRITLILYVTFKDPAIFYHWYVIFPTIILWPSSSFSHFITTGLSWNWTSFQKSCNFMVFADFADVPGFKTFGRPWNFYDHLND